MPTIFISIVERACCTISVIPPIAAFRQRCAGRYTSLPDLEVAVYHAQAAESPPGATTIQFNLRQSDTKCGALSLPGISLAAPDLMVGHVHHQPECTDHGDQAVRIRERAASLAPVHFDQLRLRRDHPS